MIQKYKLKENNYMIQKYKLKENIYKYYKNILLVLSGKNNLPLIPFDIRDIIFNYLIYKNHNIKYTKEINNINYDKEEIIQKISFYLDKIYNYTGDNKLNYISNMINYIINNSNFIEEQKNFSLTIKNKLFEFKKLLKQTKIKTQSNYNLYNKIDEALQKIYGIDISYYCINDTCCNFQSKLKINFGLCHIHLSQKFV